MYKFIQILIFIGCLNFIKTAPISLDSSSVDEIDPATTEKSVGTTSKLDELTDGSTKSSLTTINGPTSDATEFVCPQPDGLFVDPANCHAFYHCSHEIAHGKMCPGNLVFNEVLWVCDWASNVDTSNCKLAFPNYLGISLR